MSSHVTIFFNESEITGIESTSLNNKKYYSFLGIPYAKPPTGDLRFKNPQVLENFPKYLDATKLKDSCIQHNELHKTMMGSEDCLYLNIYIPKLPPFGSLLPVLFYIHGGAYYTLTANSMTPHLFMEHDIVVVSFNYRLHALGFLNLDLPDCSGNMGLKDQMCALQWVKNNIKHFGGDPNNITLFGISSGAACAQMLAMSPLNKNLTNKLILLSGNALNNWHVNPSPAKVGFELGRKFGYEGDDPTTLLELLKSISADDILEAVLTLYHENVLLPRTHSFRPTVENNKEAALLPDWPTNLWKLVNHISIINGTDEHEGPFFLRHQNFAESIVRYEALKTFISDITSVKENLLESLFEEIISFYKITEKDDQENYEARATLLSDLLLKHYYVVPDFIRPLSSSYSVYNYKFTYCGEHNIMRQAFNPRMKWHLKGSYHADEVGYLMLQKKWHAPEKDRKVAHTLCKLWINFIKNGTPNGEAFNDWIPSTKEMTCYLQIDENLSMKNGSYNSDRAKFWKYLSEKYFL